MREPVGGSSGFTGDPNNSFSHISGEPHGMPGAVPGMGCSDKTGLPDRVKFSGLRLKDMHTCGALTTLGQTKVS